MNTFSDFRPSQKSTIIVSFHISACLFGASWDAVGGVWEVNPDSAAERVADSTTIKKSARSYMKFKISYCFGRHE